MVNIQLLVTPNRFLFLNVLKLASRGASPSSLSKSITSRERENTPYHINTVKKEEKRALLIHCRILFRLVTARFLSDNTILMLVYTCLYKYRESKKNRKSLIFFPLYLYESCWRRELIVMSGGSLDCLSLSSPLSVVYPVISHAQLGVHTRLLSCLFLGSIPSCFYIDNESILLPHFH